MNTSTQQIENSKNFESELRFIDKLNSLDKFEVDILESDGAKGCLSKLPETFKLEINARLIEDDENNIDLSFIIDDIIYETKKLGSSSSSTELKADKSVNFQTEIELKSFHSKEFSKEGLFKAFFAVDLKEIKTFHTEFETVTHQRQGIEYFYDCLRINLNGKHYDVTQLKSEAKGFYIFECLEKQRYDDFSDACFSIQQAIGFINKLMVGGEKFVFNDAGGFYYSNYIRPTIKGMYSPVTTNPYSYLDIDREIADEFYNKLTRISLENLSSLVHKIYNEPEFSVAILVILEATSIRSLLIIPSSFAVIIEQLSKYLSIEEIGLEKPITDSILKDKITKELHKVIDDNSETLSNKIITKLKRRLNEINKPINKEHLTNNEKLTRPFEQLGINLTLHDITIIEHRNDLLHGNILLKIDDSQDEEKTNLYMAYVSAKLFTLISKLILKSIGYSGYVYNQAKYLEKHMSIETDQEYFEKI
ncbi:hypothetical protein [Chryseobacterium salivictor]|uniref:ApeA N-terminal domain-containing protein n=1 Tax=Chryseobacterium salivictor TaxID=2547600 RepID=A0A4P6ZFX7_9FLAO|nr:hypothetical protein [Chryseobacterium salivictor]QBO58402.1 hypothetical protein NBC122_01587 [Chryseobacterium salivictor]